MRRVAAALLILSALGGCATTDAKRPSGCDASKAAAFVGKPLTVEQGLQAMRLAGAGTLRMIGPDQAVTMDFRADRLNVRTDREGVVQSFDCG